MPIFEYQCDDCGTKFEKLIRSANANGVVCPSCGEHHLTQQYSTFAAHGTGEGDFGADRGLSSEEMPACPGGMCQTPDLCGRN
ncbi:MAG TPA: zinc ribbon domain-containing protein [Bryobacteraceae bacterium]|nr:zinc ribbon domain-containing protein [Bryobacteraceae bacterium]